MFVSIPVGASIDSSKQNSLGQEVVKGKDTTVMKTGAPISVGPKVPVTDGGVVIIVVVETGPTEACW